MGSVEIKPDQDCGKSENIAKQLGKDFRNIAAREHLLECPFCQNSLGSASPSIVNGRKIAKLANNLRDGIACSG